MSPEYKLHDGSTCEVCKKIGDWLDTVDTFTYFLKHQEAGIQLGVQDGKIVELRPTKIKPTDIYCSKCGYVPYPGEHLIECPQCRTPAPFQVRRDNGEPKDGNGLGKSLE